MIRNKSEVTQKTIAKKAQISQTVVSHVLNEIADKYNIAEKTQKRVLEIAKKYGYKPNLLAKGLRLRRTYTIGIIIPDLYDPFFSQIVAMFEEKLKDVGFNLLLCNSKGDSDSEKLLIDLLMARKVDGLVISPVSDEDIFQKNIGAYSCPIVMIMRDFDTIKKNIVNVDNYEIGYNGTRYLLDKGYKNIFIMLSCKNPWSMGKIYEGYQQALKEKKVQEIKMFKALRNDNEFNNKINNYLSNNYDYNISYNKTKKLLKKPLSDLAIFSVTAFQTLVALHAIKDSNYALLKDIGFVGTDFVLGDIKINKDLPIIYRPVKDIVRETVQILLDKINEKSDNINIHRIISADFSMLK